ncbi:MAG TPA: glycosyltransferase [Lutibacter sp.]|nr:glycosyltransferase [Lutibacter sp.]
MPLTQKETSLIISTYSWPEALELCLNSVTKQRKKPHEVIVADDGSREKTKRVIDSYKDQLNIVHVWHEDKGFRLAEIRNKAIKKATGKYIIQIDGDIILDKNFIKDHISFAKKGFHTRGTRVKISKKLSKKLLNGEKINLHFFTSGLETRENAIRFKVLTLLLSKPKLQSSKALGCNMAFWRSDLLKINGYDNNLKGWGHEDEELCARLINISILRRKIKYNAIAYHIYHVERNKELEHEHNNMINSVRDNLIIRTENGIDELS